MQKIKSLNSYTLLPFLFLAFIISFDFIFYTLPVYSQFYHNINNPNYDYQAYLQTVIDPRLRKTLENSIKLGLIQNEEELQSVLRKYFVFPWQRSISVKLAQEIYKHSINLYELEKNILLDVKLDGKNRLFMPLNQSLPGIYNKIIRLGSIFDPKVGTPELPLHDKEIRDLINDLKNDPIILYALKVTNTSIEDLTENWFGPGAGFEHVFIGEIKDTKVSGYHWWYKFYVDERNNSVKLIKFLDDSYNGKIFTGSFEWDPDGVQGPLPLAKKPKGGFTIGNSPQILLAIGHIAIELAKKSYNNVPPSIQFQAVVNGVKVAWQLYTFKGTIRTLYPLSNSVNGNYEQQEQSSQQQRDLDKSHNHNGDQNPVKQDSKNKKQNQSLKFFNFYNTQKEIEEYYDLEEDCLKSLYDGKLTVN